MKAIKAIGAVAALGVAGWCLIAPGVVGFRYEDKMRAEFAKLANGPASQFLTLEQFDRGWFVSTAHARLKLQQACKTQSYELAYKINQFAIPFSRWARTDITITPLTPEGQPAGAPLPLTATTLSGMDGVNRTHLSGHDVPFGDPGSGQLGFSIEGDVSTAENQPVSYDLTLPALNYQFAAGGKNGGVAMRLSNLKISGAIAPDSQKADAPWASQLKQQFDGLDVLMGATPMVHAGPGSLDIAVQDQGANVGISYRTHLAALKLTPPNAQPVDLDNIDADFSYTNLSKHALVAWQKDAAALNTCSDLQNNPAALQDASMKMAMQHAGGFLSQSPSFSLDRLAIHMPQGGFNGNFAIAFDGKGVPATAISPQWLAEQGKNRVTIKAALSVDRALLDKLATLSGTPEQAAQARAMSENMLAQWQSKGWIKNDGKQVSSSLVVTAAGVTANGQALSLPAMMPGAMPPAAAVPPTPPAAPVAPPPSANPAPQAAIAPVAPQTPPAPVKPAVASLPTTPPGPPAPAEAPPIDKPAAKARPAHSLPGPQVDLRRCLALSSDAAIMRCASR